MTTVKAMSADAHDAVTLVGDFVAADELLWAAQTGNLISQGRVRVCRSGLIGPLFEIVRAREAWPEAFSSVVLEAPFVAAIDAALSRSQVTGSDRKDRAGIFPLRRLGSDGHRGDEWQYWASRVDQAAVWAGFAGPIAAEIVASLGELQDNVFRHSDAFSSGLVAYAVRPGSIEVVVSDAGIGVLASLSGHPDYACVRDAGSALKIALANGESRFGRDSGCGWGMGRMFLALANHDGDLRFRSGDHALEIRGHSPSLQARVQLGQKGLLPGLTISIVCRTMSFPNRSI